MKKEIAVTSNFKGIRLDKFLVEELASLSRAKIIDLINKGFVLVDREVKKPGYRLKPNQNIEITLKEEKNELKPYDFKVKIIYEDNAVIVVDKPTELTVHPPADGYRKTLVNALIASGKKLAVSDKLRPGVVHRLDKATSGVMVLAKTESAYQSLVSQFKERRIKKEYRALSCGGLAKDEIEVNLPLSRDKKDRLKMKVSFLKAKEARTEIKVIQRLKEAIFLSIFPFTGRMHQIRVHLNFLNLPIVGDRKYGKKDKYNELYLHAYKLGFYHPESGEFREFTADLPLRFKNFIKVHGL